MRSLAARRTDTCAARAWPSLASRGPGPWLVGLVVLLVAGAAQAEGDSLCGPFDQRYQIAAADLDLREPGVGATTAGTEAGSDRGTIVELPRAAAADASAPDASKPANSAAPEEESEAILALPKDDAGQIPTDFELGAGARIRQSFFSPVICATVSLVAGPPGASLEQLVTVVPDTSIVVANDVYASAAAEVRAVAEIAAPDPVAPAVPVVVSPPRPDPYVSLQYGLAVTGVRSARGLSAGAGVRVALLDSAPEVEHRDLAATRISAIDEQAPLETGVHGTLMAGVIGAIENNGFGIAGLAPEAEIVSIPVCKPRAAGGSCTIFDLLQGLDAAWNAEAKLVNLALSGPPNPLLERGVARLEELGLVVIAAAGNEGTREKRYPAAYPSVIGVGAVGREGGAFAAGNRGPWVELYAPGVEILSTVPGSAFAFGNGTSLAAAHVTGVLAVITSRTGDPKVARGALFRAAHARRTSPGPSLPEVCDVFRRLDLECAPAVGEPR